MPGTVPGCNTYIIVTAEDIIKSPLTISLGREKHKIILEQSLHHFRFWKKRSGSSLHTGDLPNDPQSSDSETRLNRSRSLLFLYTVN